MTAEDKLERMKAIYRDGDYPECMLSAILDVLFDRDTEEDDA